MTFTDVCAILVNEPWNVPIERIKKLTPYQVQRLYFAPRTKEGTVEIDGGGEAVSAWEIFREQWERMGLPIWRIRTMWRNIKAKWDAERGDED